MTRRATRPTSEAPLTPAQIAAIKALARALVARELRAQETHR